MRYRILLVLMGLALLFVASAATADFQLRLVSQTSSKITLGWDEQSGISAYVFYRNGQRVSHTFDGTRTTVTFSKVSGCVSACYAVEDLVSDGMSTYPVAAPPPPPPPPPAAACSDTVDNDADGKVDYPADPGCTGTTDTDETDPAPPPSAYPDASNTGPTGTLANYTGPTNITVAGTVIDSKNITSCITVSAANVVIRNSRIACSGSSVVWSGSTNLLVEDSEIVCGGTAGTTGLTPQNYTARRIEARNCENIFWAQQNVTLVDSWIHDPIRCCGNAPGGGDPHTDSFQVPGGAHDITVRHNRIYGGYVDQTDFGNSAITTGGGVSNFLVEDNILAGGGYTLRCEGSGTNTNYRIRNNRFSTVYYFKVGGFGPVNGCLPGSGWPVATEFSGNVYHETGQPIP